MNEIRRSMLGVFAALATLTATTAGAQEVVPPAPDDELAAPAADVAAQPPPAAEPVRVAPVQTYAAPAPQRRAEPAPRFVAPRQTYAPRAAYLPTRGRRPPIIGYREARQNPPELWGTGLGLFLAGWFLDFAVLTPIANAISTDREGADEQDAWAWSLIPIAGPIIQLGVGAPHPAIPIATGLMQIGGLVTFILGLTSQETVRVPIYQGSADDPNMLQIGMDAAQVEGGGQLRFTMTHL